MKLRYGIATAALVAGVTVSGGALAQSASATTDLNMRAGPGPQYPVIGSIGAQQSVTIHGCTESGNWCDVTSGSDRGWSYAEYLAYDVAGDPVVVPQATAQVEVPTVTYDTATYWDAHYQNRPFYAERERYVTTGASGGAITGGTSGAVTGALVGGPVGAAVGGVAGATIGAAVDPPERVTTYVTRQPAPEPIYLEGEVVVGAGIPEPVELYSVPEYDYNYALINQQRVLVDPQTRQIVYVYR